MLGVLRLSVYLQLDPHLVNFHVFYFEVDSDRIHGLAGKLVCSIPPN